MSLKHDSQVCEHERSLSQGGEVLEDCQAVLLALLGMELRREEIASLDHGGKRIPVVTSADRHVLIDRLDVEAVYEVEMASALKAVE